ncbi:hypothetical protein KY284_020565 [Solanum tuberosum]|nr:hypothetical protein KY284_020565 [Solanum tuberosum]
MASPSQTNLTLAIVPFQDLPYYVHTLDVLYVDALGISHNAYPIQELDSTIRVSSSKEEQTENVSLAVCEGEHSISTPLTDDDTPISHLFPKQLRSHLHKTMSNHSSTPSEVFPVRMTRSVQ